MAAEMIDQFQAVLRDKYYLDDNSDLIDASSFVNIKYEYTGRVALQNSDIGATLGEGYSWASSYNFSHGAKQYFYRRIFSEDFWIVESEYCGTDCYGIKSLGGGSLLDWKDQYKVVENPNVADGFYWFGMPLFLDDNGAINIYSFFDQERGLISSDGTWGISTINGEEILEMSVPISAKNGFGIIGEANPIIVTVNPNLFGGTKYTSSRSISENELSTGYFVNSVANEEWFQCYEFCPENTICTRSKLWITE